MNKSLPMIALAALALAACSSKKDLNEDNLRAALNEMLEKEAPMCTSLPYGTSEWPISLKDPEQKKSRNNFEWLGLTIPDPQMERQQEQQKALQALADVGLIQIEAIKYDVLDPAGRPTGYTTPGKRYSLTEAAKPFLRTVHDGSKNKDDKQLCWGKIAVDKILKFRMIPDSQSESYVEYTYKLSDVADWAKNKNVIQNFGKSGIFIAKEGTDQYCNATLTEEGWKANGYGFGGCSRPGW